MSKILLVDDDPGIREVVTYTLQREGFDVDDAADGEAALEKARGGGYDVVILDVMLPLLSGLEVLAELRADPEMNRLGVVVITAQPTHRDDVFAAGADAFFDKPFDPDELVAVIEEVLSRRS